MVGAAKAKVPGTRSDRTNLGRQEEATRSADAPGEGTSRFSQVRGNQTVCNAEMSF